MNESEIKLCNWQDFDARLISCNSPISLFRESLTATKEQLGQLFTEKTPVNHLVSSHVKFVDELLNRA